MKSGELVGSGLTTQYSRGMTQEEWLQFQVQPGQQSHFQASLSSKVRSGLKTKPATKESMKRQRRKLRNPRAGFEYRDGLWRLVLTADLIDSRISWKAGLWNGWMHWGEAGIILVPFFEVEDLSTVGDTIPWLRVWLRKRKGLSRSFHSSLLPDRKQPHVPPLG